MFGNESCTSVNELGEFRDGFNEMTVDQISDPFRSDFSNSSREFNLEDSVREELFVLGIDVGEWMIDPDVITSPVTFCPVFPVEFVFTDHSELGIERDSDGSVTGQLKRRSIVECSNH